MSLNQCSFCYVAHGGERLADIWKNRVQNHCDLNRYHASPARRMEIRGRLSHGFQILATVKTGGRDVSHLFEPMTSVYLDRLPSSTSVLSVASPAGLHSCLDPEAEEYKCWLHPGELHL